MQKSFYSSARGSTIRRLPKYVTAGGSSVLSPQGTSTAVISRQCVGTSREYLWRILRSNVRSVNGMMICGVGRRVVRGIERRAPSWEDQGLLKNQ